MLCHLPLHTYVSFVQLMAQTGLDGQTCDANVGLSGLEAT
jgi:hypothetical protein